MANVVFKCPRTGMNVQHWIGEEAAPDDPHCTYETVVCKACTRLHFINAPPAGCSARARTPGRKS
jgi:hypothetical protein